MSNRVTKLCRFLANKSTLFISIGHARHQLPASPSISILLTAGILRCRYPSRPYKTYVHRCTYVSPLCKLNWPLKAIEGQNPTISFGHSITAPPVVFPVRGFSTLLFVLKLQKRKFTDRRVLFQITFERERGGQMNPSLWFKGNVIFLRIFYLEENGRVEFFINFDEFFLIEVKGKNVSKLIKKNHRLERFQKGYCNIFHTIKPVS